MPIINHKQAGAATDKLLATLPTTLHGLLAAALDDAKRILHTPGYSLDMDLWHKGADGDAPCAVCLAGAWITRVVTAPDCAIFPTSFHDERITLAMYALDHLRQGDVHSAAGSLGRQLGKQLVVSDELVDWVRDQDLEAFEPRSALDSDYDDVNIDEWFNRMHELQRRLEAEGL